MNAVEIEEAVTALAECPFNTGEFPFEFLQAFGNKETTIKRLRSGSSNKSDIGGVLQTNNIHIKVCSGGEVTATLAELRNSPSTTKAKAKFILATDGTDFEAEDMVSGETVACAYAEFPDHFGFFLSLAGISAVRQVRENAFDIRATSRLNKLYVTLLSDNETWGSAERRQEMNHFMARLIFCFFAEDTDIFNGSGLFTDTIAQMSERDGSNTHEVIREIFRAMNTDIPDRAGAKLPRWADAFPYVNGGLFSGPLDVPEFSRIARSYVLHIGSLDWTRINPDIFGSMIQAVADDEERGALGMHYTSVPNILKVLNPLFLDDLRARLEEAGDNARTLLNLRNRMARVRVFDPACGSGNFLVIAYKEMRAIEAEINRRRNESHLPTEIPLTNFRGIELRHFSAEIARLALIIAEFQCDVRYRGQKEALAVFLPLATDNWITCGNALRLDWLSICPPTGAEVKLKGDDLLESPLNQAQIDFENEGGETYVCGNPPYAGSTVKPPKNSPKQVRNRLKKESEARKADLQLLFSKLTASWKSLDYVSGWLIKYSSYAKRSGAACAFVATNSITQGEQVARLWPLVLGDNLRINFAYTSFRWSNLARHNAGVTVAILGISRKESSPAKLYHTSRDGSVSRRDVPNINAYLVPYRDIYIEASSRPMSALKEVTNGSKPVDGGHLLLNKQEVTHLISRDQRSRTFVRRFVGTEDSIHGLLRFCLWIDANQFEVANSISEIRERLQAVRDERLNSPKALTVSGAENPYAFQQIRHVEGATVTVVPRHTSELREYLPISFLPPGVVVADGASAIYDSSTWLFAILVSKIHLCWIAAVCGKLETRYRYSNTLGWNTFPVPTLTDKNKADLTRCAEDILLAREAHFPATIADLYDPEKMPPDLLEAHDRNDETLERIYIGRRFRNDTERLEKLFELYTKMTATKGSSKTKKTEASHD